MKRDIYNSENPVVRAALAVESAFERAVKAHRRALLADLKRKAKGKDGWTPWQITGWLIREVQTCTKHSGAPIDTSHSIELRIRARVAIELLANSAE